MSPLKRDLDLSDPEIRAMAERNHRPKDWRCPTRKALDALERREVQPDAG